MAKQIDRERLKKLRERAGFTLDDLAKKTGVSRDTIHRIERGRQSGTHGRTQDVLAKALGVSIDQLTGGAPIGSGESEFSVRMANTNRNALELISRRYNVTSRLILELAPFLFTLAAEASLERRQRVLSALQDARAALRAAKSDAPYLLGSEPGSREEPAEEAIEREVQAIAARYLFGPISWDVPVVAIDNGGHFNPFEKHLYETFRSLTALSNGEAAQARVSPLEWDVRGGPDWQIVENLAIGADEALELAGGRRDLAEALLRGWAPLHKMPPALADDEAKEERINWIRYQYLCDRGDPPDQDEEPISEEQLAEWDRKWS